jgi:hypothetical protein
MIVETLQFPVTIAAAERIPYIERACLSVRCATSAELVGLINSSFPRIFGDKVV